MRHKYSWLVTNGLIIVFMAGCSQGLTTHSYKTNTPPPTINQIGGTEISPGTVTPTLPTLMPELNIAVEDNPENVYDPTLEIMVEKSRVELAQRLNIDQSQIMLIETKSIQWPDTSLGCPKSGMTYAQVLTPGYWVLLESSDRIYEYHTDNYDTFILCDSTLEGNNPGIGIGENVEDGWPNQTRDNDVIILTPTKKP